MEQRRGTRRKPFREKPPPRATEVFGHQISRCALLSFGRTVQHKQAPLPEQPEAHDFAKL